MHSTRGTELETCQVLDCTLEPDEEQPTGTVAAGRESGFKWLETQRRRRDLG